MYCQSLSKMKFSIWEGSPINEYHYSPYILHLHLHLHCHCHCHCHLYYYYYLAVWCLFWLFFFCLSKLHCQLVSIEQSYCVHIIIMLQCIIIFYVILCFIMNQEPLKCYVLSKLVLEHLAIQH